MQQSVTITRQALLSLTYFKGQTDAAFNWKDIQSLWFIVDRQLLLVRQLHLGNLSLLYGVKTPESYTDIHTQSHTHKKNKFTKYSDVFNEQLLVGHQNTCCAINL